MVVLMDYNGVEISRADFGSTLRDKIAFDICFYSGIGCKDRKAALNMLRHAAESIIEQVRESE